MIDDKLDIYSTFDLDLRQTYRIRFGLVTNFSYLKKEALDRVRSVPGLGDILIRAIDSSICKYGTHPDIGKSQMSDVDRKLVDAAPAPLIDPNANPALDGYIPKQFPPGRTTPSNYIPSDFGRNLPMSTIQISHLNAQRKG